MKIMLLTQWFDPEPAFKGLAFARQLIKESFSVEVVTGFPNYPTGKIYPGYKLHLLQREYIDDVQITRVPLYPSHDSSAFKRILNYTSFGLSSLIYGLFWAKKPDVIYVYHPPLTTAISAIIIRFFKKVPVVYDIQDMWPDTLAATEMLKNKKLLALIGRICLWVYKHADKIVVLSPGFKALLIQRGVQEDKIQVIYNWCHEDALKSINQTSQLRLSPYKLNILFAGNIGYAQGLDAIVRAAEKLSHLALDVAFVLLGNGVALKTLKDKIKAKNLNNIICLPAVPMHEVSAYLNAADILLVHLKDNPLFSVTIPSKTQAYMAIGKPILMAVRGDAAELVKTAECGITASPEDAENIVSTILKFIEMSEDERRLMGEKGQAYYFKHLSLDVGVKKFTEQFYSLNQSTDSAVIF